VCRVYVVGCMVVWEGDPETNLRSASVCMGSFVLCVGCKVQALGFRRETLR
jgi:hypothetical protein